MYNDYNFKLWCKNRIITRVDYAYRFYLNECQDLKSNPRLHDKNYRPASNSSTIEKGVPNDKLRNSLGGR